MLMLGACDGVSYALGVAEDYLGKALLHCHHHHCHRHHHHIQYKKVVRRQGMTLVQCATILKAAGAKVQVTFSSLSSS